MEKEKNTLDERVSYYEKPIFGVMKKLKSEGYKIAYLTGCRTLCDDYDKRGVGILKPRKPVQKKFLGVTWHKKQKSLYIGNLYLDGPVHTEMNGLVEADDQNWVLEVYGRKNVPELTKLVEEISEPQNTKVKVMLGSEKSKVECEPMPID